jgi:hypothetical protein
VAITLTLVIIPPVITGCGRTGAAEATRATTEKKLSIPDAEAALARMFSDTEGKANFACSDGGNTRYEFICNGRYTPIDPSDGVVAHKIGVSVSHYEEGKPVFAIQVIRDGTTAK